jgi:hypothetical protein
MKVKILILFSIFLLCLYPTFADNVKKKCPKNVYIPGNKQYKGKKVSKKSNIKNVKYY